MKTFRSAMDPQLGKPSERSLPKTLTNRYLAPFALGTALALGVGTFATSAVLFWPRTTMAQEGYQELGGKTLKVIKLDKTFAALEAEMKKNPKIHVLEQTPGTPGVKYYIYAIRTEGGSTFFVGLKPGQPGLEVYPPDQDSKSPDAKAVVVDLKEPIRFVEDNFGTKVARVKAFLETGTSPVNGRYENLTVFPLDANGNIITRLGSGQYVVFAATQYNNHAGGSMVVVSEPGDRDTLARK